MDWLDSKALPLIVFPIPGTTRAAGHHTTYTPNTISTSFVSADSLSSPADLPVPDPVVAPAPVVPAPLPPLLAVRESTAEAAKRKRARAANGGEVESITIRDDSDQDEEEPLVELARLRAENAALKKVKSEPSRRELRRR